MGTQKVKRKRPDCQTEGQDGSSRGGARQGKTDRIASWHGLRDKV